MARKSRTRAALRVRPLFSASDHGRPITLPHEPFVASGQRGWDSGADAFARINEIALRELNVTCGIVATRDGLDVQLTPGDRAGAVPLRSARTRQVAGGLVVQPRFGWTGVGRVLGETGWAAAPRFCELPMVPGSGREIPPWVLAGPVVARLKELLANLKRGYREVTENLHKPRGRTLWQQYSAQLAKGAWHTLPCQFSTFGPDLMLRSNARWTLERVGHALGRVPGTDLISSALTQEIRQLLQTLADVSPRRPTAQPSLGIDDAVVRLGIEAMGWIRDERGMGAGQEMDGLAWSLELNVLWESYVESVLRREAAVTGEELKSGREGKTAFPLVWTHGPGSMKQLVPDFVMRRGRSVRVIDAKYKAHFAELDEEGWYRMANELRDAHRADIHQVLAYAALYSADEIQAELVYPLRPSTFAALERSGSNVATATLRHGERHIQLKLRGIPFGQHGR